MTEDQSYFKKNEENDLFIIKRIRSEFNIVKLCKVLFTKILRL